MEEQQAQLVAHVQEMQRHHPRIEVVVERGGEEQVLPAEQWLELAAGQWLHQRLGGTEDIAGAFRCARRVL